MADGFKYALLLVSRPDAPETPTQLSHGIWASKRSVESLVPASAVSHWREFLGSREWEELTKSQLIVDARLTSDRAEVLDGEHRQLESLMSRARLALLLTGPVGLVSGETRILSGQAVGPASSDGLYDIRQIPFRGDTIVRPYCTTVEGFWKLRPWDSDTGWFERWRELVGLLADAEVEHSSLLLFGLLAFNRSFTPLQVEFKIPDCVRAAEVVLGLPQGPGGGRAAFARRSLELAPELMHDWFVGGTREEVRQLLERLYVLRNECVHGKVPFESLLNSGLHNEREAARLEYLAETLARKALVCALRCASRRTVFADRTALEAAWEMNQFPRP